MFARVPNTPVYSTTFLGDNDINAREAGLCWKYKIKKFENFVPAKSKIFAKKRKKSMGAIL